MSARIGLQLFTVREELGKDFQGTLEKIASIGYSGVEFAGYGGLKADELKNLLDRLNLKAAGSHVGIEQLENEMEKVIEYNKIIENKYLVIPYKKYDSYDEFIEIAKLFNDLGEKCQEEGIILCYHNHYWELDKFDGKIGLDIIYDNSSKDYLQSEIDTYWVKYAGIDPVNYVKKYKGRTPLIHLKDMIINENGDKEFAEIGEGIMDIKEIAKTAMSGGAEWLIVEQDQCKRPALESVKISFENLQKMGLV